MARYFAISRAAFRASEADAAGVIQSGEVLSNRCVQVLSYLATAAAERVPLSGRAVPAVNASAVRTLLTLA